MPARTSARFVFADGTSRSTEEIAVGEIFRAGWIDVVIEAPNTPKASLNSAPLQLRRLRAGEWLTGIDTSRACGVQEFIVSGGEPVLFVVDDGKIVGEEYVALLRFVGRDGFGTSGSSAFLQKASRETFDLHIPAAARWIERRAPSLLAAAHALLDELPMQTRLFAALSERSRPPYDLAASFSAYREKPNLLERHADGIVEIDGDHWMPLKAVSVEPDRRSSDELEAICAFSCVLMRRLLAITASIASLNASRREVGLGASRLFARISSQARRPQMLRHTERSFSPSYSRLARTFPSSVRVLKLVNELREIAEPLTPASLSEILAATRTPDKLYELFTGRAIAKMLGLTAPPEPPDEHNGPIPFAESKDYALFFQQEVSALGLDTWRSKSLLPDAPTPDFMLERKADGRFLIVDAKYRRNEDEPDNDSMRTAHYYMETLRSTKSLIAYPPANISRKPFLVDGEGKTIVCMPLRPDDDSISRAGAALLSSLQSLLDGSVQKKTQTGATISSGVPARADSSA